MYQQIVQGKKISPLMGIIWVVGIVAALMLTSILSQLIARIFAFEYASLLGWGVAALLAVWLMQSRIMEYRYTLSQGRLYLERKFGEHTKVLQQIELCDIAQLGPADELLPRFKKMGPVNNLCLKANPLPRMLLVYRLQGLTKMALIQPDEELTRLIREHMGFPKDVD